MKLPTRSKLIEQLKLIAAGALGYQIASSDGFDRGSKANVVLSSQQQTFLMWVMAASRQHATPSSHSPTPSLPNASGWTGWRRTKKVRLRSDVHRNAL